MLVRWQILRLMQRSQATLRVAWSSMVSSVRFGSQVTYCVNGAIKSICQYVKSRIIRNVIKVEIQEGTMVGMLGKGVGEVITYQSSVAILTDLATLRAIEDGVKL